MKNRLPYLILLVIAFYLFNPTLSMAKEVNYNRTQALKYASDHCSTSTYDHGDYKCWNGTLKECENYKDSDGDGKGDGPKRDCANFVSQCLIDGRFDFNIFNYKKYGAVTIGKKGTDKEGYKGFPAVRNLLPILKDSFCFEVITDPSQAKEKAKKSDVLSYKKYSHVVIYSGNRRNAFLYKGEI